MILMRTFLGLPGLPAVNCACYGLPVVPKTVSLRSIAACMTGLSPKISNTLMWRLREPTRGWSGDGTSLITYRYCFIDHHAGKFMRFMRLMNRGSERKLFHFGSAF